MNLAPWLVALLVAAAPGPEAGDRPVILDFTATWCGPCQTTRPEVARAKQQGLPIREVDVDQEPDLAGRYNVSAVPTFVVVERGGRELARTTGAQTAETLAALYRKGAARVSGASARPVVRAQGDDEEAAETEERTWYHPWETVVRIKVRNHLARPREAIGYGSGTIIHSTPEESIILTCAHIFHIEELRATPPPSKFPLRVYVDLFDGRLNGPKGQAQQVHTAESDIPAQVLDFDFAGDVALVRIRPGRRLPYSAVVPPGWRPSVNQKMTTLGCSHGQDATAWTTYVTKERLKLQTQGGLYEATECAFPPMQGRSGGGLFTLDGRVAGVCDFNDGPRGRHGLYAAPESIHRLLDKHRLQVCYAGEPREGRPMLARNERPAGRAARDEPVTIRGQSPEAQPVTMPSPELLNVKLPAQVAALDEDDAPADEAEAGRGTPWRSGERRRPVQAGLRMDPSADGDLFSGAPEFDERRPSAPARERDTERPARRDSGWQPAEGPR
jgi:thiol-disulfide isomerase/thioredoxin